LKNTCDVENDAYKTPIFAYNRELDLLVSTNSITRSDVEKESSPPNPEDAMMNSKEETTNSDTTQQLHHSL
jgi:hypothetical protein